MQKFRLTLYFNYVYFDYIFSMTQQTSEYAVSISPAPEHTIDFAVSQDFKDAFRSILNAPAPHIREPISNSPRWNVFYEPFLKVLKGETISPKDYIYLETFSNDRDFIREIFDTLEDKRNGKRKKQADAPEIELWPLHMSLKTHFHKNLFSVKVQFAIEGKLKWVEPEYIANLGTYVLVKIKDAEGLDEVCAIHQDGTVYSPVHMWKPGKTAWLSEDILIKDIENDTSKTWKLYWKTSNGFDYYSFESQLQSSFGWEMMSHFQMLNDTIVIILDRNHLWYYSLKSESLIFSIQFEWDIPPSIEKVETIWWNMYTTYSMENSQVVYDITQRQTLTKIKLDEWRCESVFHMFGKPVVLYRKNVSHYRGRPLKKWVLMLIDGEDQTYIFPTHLNDDTEAPYDIRAYEFGSYNPDTMLWREPDDIDGVLDSIIDFKPASYTNNWEKPLDKHPHLQDSLTVPFLVKVASWNFYHLMISKKEEDIVQHLLDDGALIFESFVKAYAKFWKKIEQNISEEEKEYVASILKDVNTLSWISNEDRLFLYQFLCNEDFYFVFIQCLVERCWDSSDIEVRSLNEVLDLSEYEMRRRFLRSIILHIEQSRLRWNVAQGEFFERYEILTQSPTHTFYVDVNWEWYVCQEGTNLFNNVIFCSTVASKNKDRRSEYTHEEGVFAVQKNKKIELYRKVKDSSSQTWWKTTSIAALTWVAWYIYSTQWDIFLEYTQADTTYLYSTKMNKVCMSLDESEWAIEWVKALKDGYYISVRTPSKKAKNEWSYIPSSWFALLWDTGMWWGRYSIVDGFETIKWETLIVGKDISQDERYLIMDTDGNMIVKNVTQYEIKRNDVWELVLTWVYDTHYLSGKKPKLERFYIQLHQK